jgi:cyanophycinase
MPGLIVLAGGNEFRPDCERMDRSILARLGPQPKVVILPTAAARENPNLAAENGVRHFRRLGAVAEAAMVIDPATAGEKKWASMIQKADLVYLAGGDPVYLLETLSHSPAWEAARKSMERGAILAGSSAGAMIFGGQMWAPGRGWRVGLGLLPQIAVLPHHARLAAAWKVEEMTGSLSPGMTLVGIDEATALVGPPWEVAGKGNVAVYELNGTRVYTHAQAVNLVTGMGP